MNLREIGLAIQSRRKEAGLLQGQLAKLSGLSRVTVNQLENGTIKDIGYAKLKGLLDMLSVDMKMNTTPTMSNALVVAARTISTSYKDQISADELARILQCGQVPLHYRAHLMTLLDETPLPVVLRAVREAATIEIPVKKIVRHMSHWAREWKTHREVF